MFNFRKEQFDHRQGSMIDGRTVSRLAPAPGSPQLRVDLAKQPDVALTSVKVTRTSPLLSASTRKTSRVHSPSPFPSSSSSSSSFFVGQFIVMERQQLSHLRPEQVGLINPSSVQLYELEVNTAQGVYYIDRTFEELADMHAQVG